MRPVAMRVRFDTPGGAPPPQSSLYFRGPVLTAFNGRDWYALSQPEARGITWAYPTPANLQMQGESVRYEVTLEPSRRPWLLTRDAVQERPELTTYTLRLPKATAGFKAEVLALAGKGLDGKSLRACK